jgi:hypothetical protein
MTDKPAGQQIDDIIEHHGGWRAELLTHLRSVINRADPAVSEAVKWKMPSRPEGLPVWVCNGNICFTEIYKDNLKLLFPKGALLKDPSQLFNSRLKSQRNRGIEFREGDKVDEAALTALVREAIELNK